MAEEVGQPEPIQLGNFYAGEIPDPILYRFQNYDETTKDLSAATDVEFQIEKDGGAAADGGGTAELVPLLELPVLEETGEQDTVQGWVRYTFVTADLAVAGHYEALFWVTTPDNEWASKKIVFYAQSGPRV